MLIEQLSDESLHENEEMIGFVAILRNDLPDERDNRGKRHVIAFVIVAFVLATLNAYRYT